MIEWLTGWKNAAPALAVCVAVASALVAICVFAYTRRANRRRATLDMVMKTLLDEPSQKRYARFKQIMAKEKDLSDCFKVQSLFNATEGNSEDRNIVLQQMNIYELIALGIRRNLFDEMFYKRWFHNQFMTDYQNCKPFIDEAKNKKSTIYCEATALYDKWYRVGHPESTPGRLKMAWWALRNDTHQIDIARASAKTF
jgi:Domain of unknown function (DUF4760)